MVRVKKDNLYGYTGGTWDKLWRYAYDVPNLVHTEGLYAIVDSGEAKIIGYDGAATDLVIPSNIPFGNGIVPVYSIGKMAFFGNEELASVTISGVTEFDASHDTGIFQFCTN